MRYLILCLLFCSLGFGLLNAFYQYGSSLDTSLANSPEEFNPALNRLCNITQVLQYCDSIYGNSRIAPADSLAYANVVAHTLRLRFYHGLSTYGFCDNWVLYALQWVHPHSLAIVYENDILKHNQALCSQQSIVGMMALKQKGFTFRKVGFKTKNGKAGHFTYEIRLADGWHFYDVDKEPNLQVLEAEGRPSIKNLAKNDTLRRNAYAKNGKRVSDDLIPYYNTNFTPNAFPARNMLLFQRLCQLASYSLWLVMGLLYYWRYAR
jgi:hypothetical protein